MDVAITFHFSLFIHVLIQQTFESPRHYAKCCIRSIKKTFSSLPSLPSQLMAHCKYLATLMELYFMCATIMTFVPAER